MHIGTFLSGFIRDIILSSELNNMWLLPFLVLQYIWQLGYYNIICKRLSVMYCMG